MSGRAARHDPLPDERPGPAAPTPSCAQMNWREQERHELICWAIYAVFVVVMIALLIVKELS